MGLLDRSGSTAMEVILNRPAYFPGDELLAFLAFQPTPADSSCRGRSILWVTAQVYGRVDLHADWQFLVRGNEVLPPTSTGPRRLSTSVVDTGSSNHQQRCIFTTGASILGSEIPCDKPHSFIYKVQIPETGAGGDVLPATYPLRDPFSPPTDLSYGSPAAKYLSNSIRFSYFLAITFQLSHQDEPQVLEVPFPILSPGAVLKTLSCCRVPHVVPLDIGAGITVDPDDRAALANLFESAGRSTEGRHQSENPRPYDLLAIRRSSAVGKKQLGPALRQLYEYLPPALITKHQQLSSYIEDKIPDSAGSLLALQRLHQSYYSSNASGVTYRIGLEDSTLLHVCLLRTYFTPGETIVGTMRFEADHPCLQTYASLEMIETLNEDELKRSHPKSKSVRTVSVANENTHSACARVTQFELFLPFSAVQEMHTCLVDITWQISFQFLVTKTVNGKSNTDTLRWQLPIHVVPLDYPAVSSTYSFRAD